MCASYLLPQPRLSSGLSFWSGPVGAGPPVLTRLSGPGPGRSGPAGPNRLRESTGLFSESGVHLHRLALLLAACGPDRARSSAFICGQKFSCLADSQLQISAVPLRRRGRCSNGVAGARPGGAPFAPWGRPTGNAAATATIESLEFCSDSYTDLGHSTLPPPDSLLENWSHAGKFCNTFGSVSGCAPTAAYDRRAPRLTDMSKLPPKILSSTMTSVCDIGCSPLLPKTFGTVSHGDGAACHEQRVFCASVFDLLT